MGGAIHNVFFSSEIPKAAVRKDVELAHGTRQGYVKDGDITFVDDSVRDDSGKDPSIITLGRLIEDGSKMEWSNQGANLTLPGGKRLGFKIRTTAHMPVLKF